jgi:hypothetical protein
MTCLEHYFENLLYHGKDVNGEYNKKNLTPLEQQTVEACADYVLYSLFGNRELFLKCMDTWEPNEN